MIPLKFWHWLRAYTEKKIRDASTHERRCPNCGCWSSVVGVTKYHDLDVEHTGMTCGQCGYESKWDMLRGGIRNQRGWRTLTRGRLATQVVQPRCVLNGYAAGVSLLLSIGVPPIFVWTGDSINLFWPLAKSRKKSNISRA